MTSSSAEAAWAGLVRAALLGTDRADPGTDTGAAADPLLRAIFAGLAGLAPEARLLGAAAALAQYRRVGDLGGIASDPAPEPAAAETSRRCPERAGVHLRLMLDGVHREALPEWLQRLVEKGFTVAPEDLPGLLDACRYQSLPNELIVAAAGARGRWLAALNLAWRSAVLLPDDDTAWDTGTTEARVAVLRRLRATRPAAGLERLRSTWATESAPQRALFLPILELGLTMADEPFLEEALDDRRKEVRSIAAGLLARLPASRLVGRMTERVRPLVRIPPHGGGKLARVFGRTKVEVDLPVTCDNGMVRDGIEPKPPRGTGERAWWLAQMVAAVPPSLWTQQAGLSPEECIAAAARTDWRELLIRAWSIGAARTNDADWAEALLAAWAAGEHGVEPGPLASALPPERLERVVSELIEAADGEVTAGEPGLLLAAEARHAWSPALTHSVMRRLVQLPPTTDYALRALLANVARRMHAATAVASVDGLGERARGAWVDLLHHRHAMLEALEK